MATAYDEKGNPLGPEILAPTAEEALKLSMQTHNDAAEYRIRKLRESVKRKPEVILAEIRALLDELADD